MFVASRSAVSAIRVTIGVEHDYGPFRPMSGPGRSLRGAAARLPACQATPVGSARLEFGGAAESEIRARPTAAPSAVEATIPANL